MIGTRAANGAKLFNACLSVFTLRGVATMEATRGNNSYLNALVLRHGDASELMQAVGLPFDWSSLQPKSTQPENDHIV